ncbi:pyridoxamine 5'-phosphate oxidase family protein [Streptomyces libani]|uniref:pyridoxamine 5'-phosphate oxidase family protein n=1 Tax=Streptomyces TaxID=1883 RepID=UPI00225996EF|nr:MULTISPECIES: pyridoxamine 5'-phosphate oxidase family protein [Streptomyces]MCX5444767.1 pyridoxamine 5'-phosphate oxidase family protein [Streptomyces libani]MCX5449387.1 pyridoxamine 5'-phosphate oxidase family protein [Streptomyces libani]WDT56398.1 pyridoxamine 5'-phosphate oxidase family protein [Streptomyces sp. G7(2002)]
MPRQERPGSDGEHLVQQRLGTTERADRFYGDQVLDHLNVRMQEFVARQEMFFLATADRHGECDSTFRAGPPGFVRVLDDRTLAYPEYRGNGVMASIGNISENPRLGILMIDFTRDRIGLHINGRARVVLDEEMRAQHAGLPVDPVPGRRAQLWVTVEVEEAYIHCAKHIPHLQKVPAQQRGARAWGTDDSKRKGGDFFGAAAEASERPPFRRAERGNEHLRGGLHEDTGEAAYQGAAPVYGGGPAQVGVHRAARAEPAYGAGPGGSGRGDFVEELNAEFLDRVERVLARAQPRRPSEDEAGFRGWFDRRDG